MWAHVPVGKKVCASNNQITHSVNYLIQISVAGNQIQSSKPGEIQNPFKHLLPFLGKKRFPWSDYSGQEILPFKSKQKVKKNNSQYMTQFTVSFSGMCVMF